MWWGGEGLLRNIVLCCTTNSNFYSTTSVKREMFALFPLFQLKINEIIWIVDSSIDMLLQLIRFMFCMLRSKYSIGWNPDIAAEFWYELIWKWATSDQSVTLSKRPVSSAMHNIAMTLSGQQVSGPLYFTTEAGHFFLLCRMPILWFFTC